MYYTYYKDIHKAVFRVSEKIVIIIQLLNMNGAVMAHVHLTGYDPGTRGLHYSN